MQILPYCFLSFLASCVCGAVFVCFFVVKAYEMECTVSGYVGHVGLGFDLVCCKFPLSVIVLFLV